MLPSHSGPRTARGPERERSQPGWPSTAVTWLVLAAPGSSLYCWKHSGQADAAGRLERGSLSFHELQGHAEQDNGRKSLRNLS